MSSPNNAFPFEHKAGGRPYCFSIDGLRLWYLIMYRKWCSVNLMSAVPEDVAYRILKFLFAKEAEIEDEDEDYDRYTTGRILNNTDTDVPVVLEMLHDYTHIDKSQDWRNDPCLAYRHKIVHHFIWSLHDEHVECGNGVSSRWIRLLAKPSSKVSLEGVSNVSIRYQNYILLLKKYDFMKDDYEVKNSCFEDGRFHYFMFSHLYSSQILRLASVNHPIIVVESPQRTMLTQTEKITARMPMLETLLISNVPAVCFVDAAICALVGGTMNSTFGPAMTGIVITVGQKTPEFKQGDSHSDSVLGLTSCLSASSVVVVNNRVVASTLVQFERPFTSEFKNLLISEDEEKKEDATSSASSFPWPTVQDLVAESIRRYMMEELVDTSNHENIEYALKNVVVAGAGGDEEGFKECLQEKLRLADIGTLAQMTRVVTLNYKSETAVWCGAGFLGSKSEFSEVDWYVAR